MSGGFRFRFISSDCGKIGILARSSFAGANQKVSLENMSFSKTTNKSIFFLAERKKAATSNFNLEDRCRLRLLWTRREQHRGGFCLFREEEEEEKAQICRDIGADLFWSVLISQLVCPDLSKQSDLFIVLQRVNVLILREESPISQ